MTALNIPVVARQPHPDPNYTRRAALPPLKDLVQSNFLADLVQIWLQIRVIIPFFLSVRRADSMKFYDTWRVIVLVSWCQELAAP